MARIDAALQQAESDARDDALTQEIVARINLLSPRERQVMDGLAVARDYNISPHTIEVYRANVIAKMQASSLSELEQRSHKPLNPVIATPTKTPLVYVSSTMMLMYSSLCGSFWKPKASPFTPSAVRRRS